MSGQLHRFNEQYWRYDTDLNDPRVLKFIEALQKHAQVRFSERVFELQHIHLTPAQAILVLREVDE